MSDISLSKGIRSNLLQLQNTADLIGRTQNRLATGKKVNSALDNPTNFFTASSLNSRANDLSNLLDGLSNGVKTLEAADNGMKAITKTVEQMQATLRQARQDKSFKTASYSIDAATIGTVTAKNITFSGGAVGTTPVNVALQNGSSPVFTAANNYGALDMTTGDETYSFTVSKNGGAAVTVTIGTADNTGGGTTIDQAEAIVAINADLTTGASTIRVRDNAGKLEFYDTDLTNLGTTASIDVSAVTTGGTTPSADGTIGWTGNPAAVTGTAAGAVKSVDELVAAITANVSLTGKVKASNDGGKLRIENLSTEDLSVVGATSAGAVNGGTGGANTATVGGNEVRKNLVAQFNDLRTQLDKLSDDSSFNGINLLKGDKLKLNFNETGTSSIEIQAKDIAGNVREISSAKLSITSVATGEFSSDTTIDTRLETLANALTTLRSQASTFGSNLSVVQNRTDFTKQTINTLRTGGDALTLADQNEEAANLLSLQTRQQLASTALSLANQADQGVLRLF
jgi:flagellin-like hook-associated protein FlgL